MACAGRGARSTESEGSGPTELSEPTLELGLSGVEEGRSCEGPSDKKARINRQVEDTGCSREADLRIRPRKDSCKGDGLLHGTTRRGGARARCGKAKLMGAEGLDRLNLKRAAQMLVKALEPAGSDWGGEPAIFWYLRRSKVRECCRWGRRPCREPHGQLDTEIPASQGVTKAKLMVVLGRGAPGRTGG